MRSHHIDICVFYLVAVGCGSSAPTQTARTSIASTDVQRAFTSTPNDVQTAVLGALKGLCVKTPNPCAAKSFVQDAGRITNVRSQAARAKIAGGKTSICAIGTRPMSRTGRRGIVGS